jgi:hypothetical protein
MTKQNEDFVPLMRSGYEATKEFIIAKGYG